MRFMLISLPVFWLAIFWALERWRVRSGWIFLAAAAYTLCALMQILGNTFESGEVAAENYQLKDDWLSRFPPWHADGPSGITLTRSLLGFIQKALPAGGKIAVGTEQLFLTSESLNWVAQAQPALRGEDSPYEFNNFLTSDGHYARKSLLNARGILIFLHPSFQYSRAVQAASIRLAQYSAGSWAKAGVAQIMVLQAGGGTPLGALILPKEPLSDARITELIQATQTPELARDVEFGETTERRITWREGWDLLVRWEQQRLGWAAP